MSIFYQNRSERLRFYTSHNISFAAHLHRQAELVVLLEGEVRICVDHTEYLLSEGSAAIIFPNQLHSLETVSHSRILLCIFDDDCCHSYQQYFQKCNPQKSLERRKRLTPNSLDKISRDRLSV